MNTWTEGPYLLFSDLKAWDETRRTIHTNGVHLPSTTYRMIDHPTKGRVFVELARWRVDDPIKGHSGFVMEQQVK